MKLRAVIVKTAPDYLLNNEREILQRFRGQPSIRQLVDEVQEPPALVLEYLGQNLMDASNESKLARPVVKHVAKEILQGIIVAHDDNLVHTGAFEI